MLEYYNYEREKSGQFIVSSDYVLLSLESEGGIASALMQDSNVRYEQRVNLVPEMGSHEMYFLTGQAQGSAAVNRLVGTGGLMAAIKPGGSGNINKGVMSALSVTVKDPLGNVAVADGASSFDNIIETHGVVMRSVTWSTSAQNLTLAEAMEFVICSLSVSR